VRPPGRVAREAAKPREQRAGGAGLPPPPAPTAGTTCAPGSRALLRAPELHGASTRGPSEYPHRADLDSSRGQAHALAPAGGGRLDGRGQCAHRPRPVWLAPWGESVKDDDASHESPRATAERKWVPKPISMLGPVLKLALGSATAARHPPRHYSGRGLGPPRTIRRSGRSHRMRWGARDGEMGLRPSYCPSGPRRRSVHASPPALSSRRGAHWPRADEGGRRRMGSSAHCVFMAARGPSRT
jgi:hypothetical protein